MMNLEYFHKACVLIVVLSCGEIAAQGVLGASSNSAADRLFQSLDRDKDGTIEPSEWTTARTLRKWLNFQGVKPTQSMGKDRFRALYGKFVEEIRRRRKGDNRWRQSPGYEVRSNLVASFRPLNSFQVASDDAKDVTVLVLSNHVPQPRDDGPSHHVPNAGDQDRSSQLSETDRKTENQSARKRSKKDLPPRYRFADTNKDGQIGFYEWSPSRGAKFRELDKNNDGFLTADELNAPKSPTKPKKREKNPPNALPSKYRHRDFDADGQIGFYEWKGVEFSSFQQLDRNLDGFLTPAELSPKRPKHRRVKRSSEEQKSQKRASVMFRRMDRNRNGILDASEIGQSKIIRKAFTSEGATVPAKLSYQEFVDRYLKIEQPEL